jgi:hypothetical protein
MMWLVQPAGPFERVARRAAERLQPLRPRAQKARTKLRQ